MNKKTIGLILTVALLGMSCLAFASVPSKTTKDMGGVSAIVDANQNVITGLNIDLSKESEAATKELQKIFTHVTANNAPPATYFSDAVRSQIQTRLPDGFDIDTMDMNEFASLDINDDVVISDDIFVSFELATVYTRDQNVVALVGIQEGDNVVWIALETEVMDNGSLKIRFDAETLKKVQSGNAMLAILSGK